MQNAERRHTESACNDRASRLADFSYAPSFAALLLLFSGSVAFVALPGGCPVCSVCVLFRRLVGSCPVCPVYVLFGKRTDDGTGTVPALGESTWRCEQVGISASILARMASADGEDLANLASARENRTPPARDWVTLMAVPLEQFVKQLEDSGILAAETLMDFIPPRAPPKDAEELAKELVRQKKLT